MELNLGREPGLEGWKVSKAGAWQGLKERLSQDRPFPSRPSDETTILANAATAAAMSVLLWPFLALFVQKVQELQKYQNTVLTPVVISLE